MSTKIYNGMILRNCTLLQGLERLKRMRTECLEVMREMVAKKIAKRTCMINDLRENFVFLDSKDDSSYWIIMDEFHKAERTVKGEGTRNVDWDFTFDICLIPYGEHLLALKYLEGNKGYNKALENAGFVDFHYQNSTDRPDNISEQEWQEREDAWNNALPRSSAPADVGLSYSVVRWDCIGMAFWAREQVARSIPTDDERRKQVALKLCDLEYSKKPETSIYDAVSEIAEMGKARQETVLLAERPI